MLRALTILLLSLLSMPAHGRAQAPQPFAIRVVDEESGRGVPLVELRTTHNLVFLTDSAGLVAFDEPGLMGQKVYFHLKAHGYEYPRDGFGYRGKALDVVEGGEAELKVRRINVAERLYRITGGGIYRDSLKLGREVPIADPVLNALVFGSDSTMNAIYGGRLLWLWGDTNRPAYPLGNFHMTGATSRLPADGGLDPDLGVDLDYYAGPDGFARPIAKMEGDGPTWLVAPTVLIDPADGRERLVAAYNKIKPPLDTYRRGFTEWDDESAAFLEGESFPLDSPARPDGHTFQLVEDGTARVYFGNPLALTRVQATPEDFLDVNRYESFTCLLPGSNAEAPRIDRDDAGRARYAWRRGVSHVGPAEQAKLIETGRLKAEEALIQLRDSETGRNVAAHSGMTAWNEHRGRWTIITVELFGEPSLLGEVWYAEADTPLGPWAYARKIVTHDKYTFYNPKQHPYFEKDDGRVIYFEGTYTELFSGVPTPTPIYDYNQIMYRLDLDDPRMRLPVAQYGEAVGGQFGTGPENSLRPLAFFAPDRPAEGTIAIFREGSGLRAGGEGESPLFHALPSDLQDPPATTVLLLEFRAEDGRLAYSTDPEWHAPGFGREGRPLARVWRDPWAGNRPWIAPTDEE